MTTQADNSTSRQQMEPCVPTQADFKSLAEMKAVAFAEKGVTSDGGKTYEKYLQKSPQKLQHCRIIHNPEKLGMVIGAIQLQMKGDPGDHTMPSGFRHELMPGEAYIEFIACHPDHTGKGIGSKLLAWADKFAIEQGCRIMSLEVMKANDGAVRLYERKGFVVKRDPHNDDVCDEFIGGCFVFCCLGCRYWSLLYMEKALPKKSDLEQEQLQQQQQPAPTLPPEINNMSRT